MRACVREGGREGASEQASKQASKQIVLVNIKLIEGNTGALGPHALAKVFRRRSRGEKEQTRSILSGGNLMGRTDQYRIQFLKQEVFKTPSREYHF